tara:strand:- start:480 stop:2723 length:2244 start_codon:yes stop_codon:yes gene_type:complete
MIKEINISSLLHKKLTDEVIANNHNHTVNKTSDNALKELSSYSKHRKIYSWINDTDVTKCYNCKQQFTIMNRKHHCRNCGNIFCHKCSDYYINIPDNIKSSENNNYLDYKVYINYVTNNTQKKVCKICYNYIGELIKLQDILGFFNKLPLTIKEYTNIKIVCKSWNKISKHYFNKLTKLKYRLPDKQYSICETQLLYFNRRIFKKHSKWLLHLILSNDWNNNTTKYNVSIIDIIHSKTNKQTQCKELLCTQNCQEQLTLEDIMIVISKKFTYLPLIKVLFTIWESVYIQNTPDVNNLLISCYMSFLINSLNFYKNFTSISNIIQEFLLDKCLNSIPLSNQLFWILTQYISNVDSAQYFQKFRKLLVSQLDKKTYTLFQNGYDFTQNIINIANMDTDNIVNNLKKYLKEHNTKLKEFSLPTNLNKSFSQIDYTRIRDIDSKTKPIILPCITSKDKTIYNVMLKKEDIRKEEQIMNLFKLMNYFLIKDENLDLNITIYKILAISDKYGYIEFVPNSTTLYDIREKHHFSIQNWVIEKNPTMSLTELRDNISKSCALYCVITYLLGIGDRHLDNIMIKDNGTIFHIDFGYILGQDPKIIRPEIRLTHEMIDAMGGVKSKYYKNFKDYCARAYNCIRKHYSIFYILLLDITEYKPKIINNHITKDYIKNYIIERFIPGLNHKSGNEQISYKIDKNSNTYSENIIDYFHKQYKLSSKSESEPQTSILQNAYTIGISAKKKILKNITGFFSYR